MPNEDWKDSCHSWSSAGAFAHPNSTAGGCGPGVSRAPGPCGNKGSVSSSAPHPASPSGNLFAWNQNLPGMVFEERVKAVYQALLLAPDYIPKAIYDATGQELYAIVSGIVPGLVFFIGVLAASTALGAIVGGLVGALAFGAGAVPGAAAGASIGLDLGLALLDYLGIAFLAVYIGKSLLKAAEVSKDAITVAWQSVDHVDPNQVAVHLAAERLAFAVGLVFRGVLQGVVAFLLAKGTAAAASRVPELVAKFRTSKLGAGFAEWIEKNWNNLLKDPALKDDVTKLSETSSSDTTGGGRGASGEGSSSSGGSGGGSGPGGSGSGGSGSGGSGSGGSGSGGSGSGGSGGGKDPGASGGGPKYPKNWNKFNPAHNEEFAAKLRNFRGDENLERPKGLAGGEGQIFTSPKDPNLCLKRWFASRLNDMRGSVDALRDAENLVNSNPALKSDMDVTHVYQQGSDWIVRDFDPASVPLSEAGEAAQAARSRAVSQLEGMDDEAAQSILKKLTRDPPSENVHWSPVKQKLLIIDMQ